MKNEEHLLQKSFIEWCAWNAKRYPGIDLIYAVPNGGKRSKAEAGKFKAEGVRAGMPDLCLPVSHHGYHAFYIEVKTPTGRVSVVQAEMFCRLNVLGNKWAVVRSLDEFIKEIEEYYEFA